MGALTSTSRTVLGNASAFAVHGIILAFPDGDVRAALNSYNSAHYGHFEPRVVSWGAREIEGSGIDAALRAVTMRFRMHDLDRMLANRIAAGEKLIGSVATMLLSSPDIPWAESPTPIVGIVESLDPAGSLEWEVLIRPPDMPMRRDTFLRTWREGDWPRVAQITTATQDQQPDVVLGEFAPVYYGPWDSASAGSGGSVRCYNVDTRSSGHNGWAPMAGCALEVMRVYDAAALQGTGWTVEYTVRNGRVFTVILKTSGRFTGPVTADIRGIDTAGDGTGDLIENPVDQLEDALENLVWGEYLRGARLAGAAPLNAAWLAVTRQLFEDLGLRGSFRCYQREAGVDLVNRWLSSWPFLRAAWTFATGAAEIAIYPVDWRTWSTPPDWLRYWAHDDGSLVVPAYDRDRLLSTVRVGWLQNAVSNGYLRTQESRDPDVAVTAAEELSAEALAATL